MQYNDYELVDLARDGNEDAINLIYQKYKPIIIKKSKNAILFATHHGIDINDIMQEGFMGLNEAIHDFSENENATFYTFAMICIDRQIVNYLRKMTGRKERLLNDSINIDDSLERTISDKTNIENIILQEDTDSALIDIINSNLTNFEKDVFSLRLRNYSFEEIANILNRDVKAIYNAFQRIKYKIKKILQLTTC